MRGPACIESFSTHQVVSSHSPARLQHRHCAPNSAIVASTGLYLRALTGDLGNILAGLKASAAGTDLSLASSEEIWLLACPMAKQNKPEITPWDRRG